MKAAVKSLPQAIQLLYAELLQQCSMALPSQRGVSFSTKTVANKKYWYMEVVVGSGKKQYSLGRDTQALSELIEKQKALFKQASPEVEQREKLVAMLSSGGLRVPSASDGRVLELLSQSGLFLSGGVLVGSYAFNVYQEMLGVEWDTELTQTQDMDLASENQINVAIKEDAPNVKSVLLDSGMGFFEVPALSHKSPSTSFKIRGQAFHVDLLTPLQGPDDSSPIKLKHFNSYAHPVRFLEFLLEDAQIAVVPFRGGVLVNVPSPARFAFHKLVVSQRRPVSQQTKTNRDIMQAEMLFNVLLEDRPGDIWLACDVVERMPDKFRQQLKRGLRKLDKHIQNGLLESPFLHK